MCCYDILGMVLDGMAMDTPQSNELGLRLLTVSWSTAVLEHQGFKTATTFKVMHPLLLQ